MKQRAFLAIGTIVLCAGLLAGCGKVTKSVEINYGETYKIEDEKLEGKENLTWESADAEIVEVADDGTVTAKAPGKAKCCNSKRTENQLGNIRLMCRLSRLNRLFSRRILSK